MLTSGRTVASTTAAVRWARVVEEGDGEEEGVVVLLVGSGPATPSGTMAAPPASSHTLFSFRDRKSGPNG
ncbi:hypothetical protein JCM8202_000418 [Rhodotorula sphaerocarpa]